MKLRRLLLFGVVILTALMLSPTEVLAETTVQEISVPSQEEIVRYAQEHPPGKTYFDIEGNMLGDYEISYEVKPKTSGTYSAGELSLQEQVSALNTIRLIRYIVGLSDNVYLFDPYTNRAQSAALINYINGKASHDPLIPDGVDSTLAARAKLGAANSNIDRVSWKNNSLKSSILYAWMYDSDDANIKTLGHRRWILNPALVMTGFGSVTGAKGTVNTMYVKNDAAVSETVSGICWPARNTPVSFFDPSSAWSISLGEDIDSSNVVVSLMRVRDHKRWSFSSAYADGEFYVDNHNYGQKGCIIFKPKNVGQIQPGDRYAVYITYNNNSISYEVNFFDLDGYYSPDSTSITYLEINPVEKPGIEWKNIKAADVYDLYRKAKGGTWKLLADNLDDTYFDDATAAAGVKYYYRVVAKRIIGGAVYESTPSASKSITMQLGKASISSLKSTAKGKNQIKWKSVSKATGYKVYRRVSGTSKWTLVKTTKYLSYTDSKAVSGIRYEYRVRAYRSCYKNIVNGSYSAKKSVRTR